MVSITGVRIIQDIYIPPRSPNRGFLIALTTEQRVELLPHGFNIKPMPEDLVGVNKEPFCLWIRLSAKRDDHRGLERIIPNYDYVDLELNRAPWKLRDDRSGVIAFLDKITPSNGRRG